MTPPVCAETDRIMPMIQYYTLKYINLVDNSTIPYICHPIPWDAISENPTFLGWKHSLFEPMNSNNIHHWGNSSWKGHVFVIPYGDQPDKGGPYSFTGNLSSHCRLNVWKRMTLHLNRPRDSGVYRAFAPSVVIARN